MLRNLAIVLDGPLAVFGHPAWLSHAIYHELKRINETTRKVIDNDLLLIGVEKSGAFVDHYEVLDAPSRGTNGKARFKPQTGRPAADVVLDRCPSYPRRAEPNWAEWGNVPGGDAGVGAGVGRELP